MKTIITILLMSSLYLSAQTYNEVINGKVSGKVYEYTAMNGELFKIGDTLTIGKPFEPSQFTYLFQNLGTSYERVHANAMGLSIVIKKMKVRNKSLLIYTYAPEGWIYGLIFDIDDALNAEEIVSNILTSDQALEELKRWKDKLDLEIITQEEYESKKAELIKFIN